MRTKADATQGRILLPLTLVLLCLAFACSTPHQSLTLTPRESTAPESIEPDGFALTQLEFPPDGTAWPPLRQCGSSTEIELTGQENIESQGSFNYEPAGTSDYAIVSSEQVTLAWAIYGVTGFTQQRPVGMELHVKPAGRNPDDHDPLPLEYWCAVSNYTRYGWEFWGPLTGDAQITLNDAEHRDRYVSADDELYIALLVANESGPAGQGNPEGDRAVSIGQITVRQLQVTDMSYYSTRPHFPLLSGVQTDTDDTPKVSLEWHHVIDSASVENEAAEYRIHRKGPGDDDRLLLGVMAAPVSIFVDPTDTTEQALNPIAGLYYRYLITAANSAGVTPPDARRVQVPPLVAGQHQLVITEYEVRIAGASGGLTEEGDLFGAGTFAGSIAANASTALSLEVVGGEFDGQPFSGDSPSSWPSDLTENYYQAVRTATSDGLYWYLHNLGAEGFRRCSDWLVLESGAFPRFGNPGMGTVFSDDDPESSVGCPEGSLTTYLAPTSEYEYLGSEELKVHVVYPIQYTIAVDVTADLAAPRLLNYSTLTGEPLEYLYMDRPTELEIGLSWGDSGQPPSALDTSLHLHNFRSNGTSSGPVIRLDYVENYPSINEFTYLLNNDKPVILCKIAHLSIGESGHYAFRLLGHDQWSTINVPGLLLGAGSAPPIPEIVVFPDKCDPEVDCLQVFWTGPRIRRDPGVYYDTESENITPVDLLGYHDLLKPNGKEFYVSYRDGFFPRVAVVEGSNPLAITSWTDSIPGVLTFDQDPNKLWVDIAAITDTGNPSDPWRVYSFRVFNQDGQAEGGGTFAVSPVDLPVQAPVGIDWGVNVFNRESKSLTEREFTTHVVDADAVYGDAPEPDVLWLEVGGGWLFDSSQEAGGVYRTPDEAQTGNLLIAVTDESSGDKYFMGTAVRVVLPSEGDSFLLLHELSPADFAKQTDPDWVGILNPGHEFTLALDDPRWTGAEYEFEDKLVVIGTNPNDA